MRSTAIPSAGRKRRVHSGPSASLIPSYSPAVSPSAKAKVRLLLIAITFGLRAAITSFSTCHCWSPHSSAVSARVLLPAAGAATAFVERMALKTSPCDEPPSAIRSTPFPPTDALSKKT